MNSDRKAAIWIGVLYIIGTVSGVLSYAVMGPIMSAPDYAGAIAEHPQQMVIGVLLVLTMGLALSMVPALFWRIGKRYDETLAMGFVVFRGALEGAIYIIIAFLWLALIALATAPTAASTSILEFVRSSQTVVSDQLTAIPFVLGAAMFYSILYRYRLVPRWLSVWGLVGGALYIVAPLTNMFGLKWGFVMGPLALQEMVMAVWLIAKGFNATTSPSLAMPRRTELAPAS